VTLEKPREIAARALQRWQRERQFIEEILNEVLADAALSSADRRLAQEISYGAIRWQATLDWLIDRKAGRRDPTPILRVLLRLGLYQLFWLDRIPDHAAVHETVETAKRLGWSDSFGTSRTESASTRPCNKTSDTSGYSSTTRSTS
jgi:16S rRNA (cytosine967-C5)-methyltransferase